MAEEKAKKKAEPKAKVEKVADEKPAKVLVYMERNNPTYEVWGVVFTQEQRIRAVDADVADNIFATNDGFRVATPAEAREFYA